MVLKRILMTALGALGMGALAAGTASAQTGPGDGNIPAPDLFNPQIACSMNVPAMNPMPTVLPKGEKPKSLLDLAIGMGNRQLVGTTVVVDNSANTALDDITIMDVVAQLGFVIDPHGSNCGKGEGTLDMPIAAFAATGMGAQGPIATDVAEGYSDLLMKYVAVYGAPGDAGSKGSAGDVADKQKALTTALEGRTATVPNTVAIEFAQEQLDEALEAHSVTVAAYNAIAQGPIYQAGVAEWMAKAAVTDSIASYNSAVIKTNLSEMVVDELNYEGYVPLRNTDLTDGLTDADGNPSIVNLRKYANLHDLGDTIAVQDKDSGEITGTGNFDAAGNLLIPLSNQDNNDETPITPTTLPQTVEMIRDRVEMATDTLADLKKAQADNKVAGLNEVYTEAVRRVQAEVDHYNGQMAATLADDTLQEGGTSYVSPVMDDPLTLDVDERHTSIAAQQAAYTKNSNAREIAEVDLRAKAAAREAATAQVVDQFYSPASFYQQLVDRRNALKSAADAAVVKASEDGATPSEALTDAATARAEGVTDALETQAEYLAYVGEQDGPTAALIAELLKGDGDDGGALVAAIGAVYNTARSAVADAEAVINQLTGPDGQVTVNTAGIATNAADIADLDGRVTVNEGAIAQNAEDIITNAGNIMENRGMIETNATGIMMNKDMIAEMGGAISSNTAGIATNAASITTNSNGIRTLRSGVAAAMAMAGMPEIGDRGVAVGAASYDGESAFAVGVHFSGENSRFKAGITSSGGETGISVGAGWGF